MTNSERADRLLGEAVPVAAEMRTALQDGHWNLAVRRAQEVLELVVKGLLNEMGVEYPHIHDAAPLLVEAVHARGFRVDKSVLDWLTVVSADLARLRGPAFYQEIAVSEAQASEGVSAAEQCWSSGVTCSPG